MNEKTNALELAAEEERKAMKANSNIHHKEIDMRKVFKDRFMPDGRTMKGATNA